MPEASEEMIRQDSHRAWAAWAKNAPLDLLPYFEGELITGPAGPRGQHSVHLEVDSDGGDVAVNLHFAKDED